MSWGVLHQIKEYEDKKAANERILLSAPELIRREGFDLLDKHREDCIKKGFFTLKSMTEKQGMYNKWIREEKEKWGAKKEQSGSGHVVWHVEVPAVPLTP